MKKMINYIILFALIVMCICDASQNLEYEKKDGIQLYYFANGDYFLYATLSGDENKIAINLTLFTAQNLEAIDKSNGIWAGIGFGSAEMDKSDVVLFTYNKENGGLCQDYWGTGNQISKDSDLVGNNDLTYKGLLVTSTNTLPYLASYSWTCEKSLTNLDNNDWSDLNKWQTNKGKTIGYAGLLGDNGEILQNKYFSNAVEIVDGANILKLPKKINNGSILTFSLAVLSVIIFMF